MNVHGPEHQQDLQNQHWTEEAEATDNTVTATKAASAQERHLIFGFFVMGDAEGVRWELLNGTTVIHRGRLPGIGFKATIAKKTAHKNLVPLVVGDEGGSVSLRITHGTLRTQASIYGLTILA